MPRPTCKKSIVWEFFDISSDKKTVTCKLCNKSLINHKNTSNYKEHLKRLHPIQLQQKEEERGDNVQPTQNEITTRSPLRARSNISQDSQIGNVEDDTNNNQETSDGHVKRKRRQLRLCAVENTRDLSDEQISDLDEAVLNMIVLDYQPLSIVDDIGFKKLVCKLNKKYTLPSRKTLSEKLLPHYYNRIKEELKLSLFRVDYISLTCDYWKGLNQRTYLSLTGHYIQDFRIHASTLATVEVSVSHTGVNTAEAITNICQQWNILDKVVTVVTDNAANMRKAIAEDLRKHHHPCVAHTINLTVNDALESDQHLTELITKCTSLVRHFKQSSVAANKLKEKQAELCLSKLVLKQDVVTRWNSTYLMLERLVTVRQPLCLALMELERAPENLSTNDWTVVKDILPILKPFMEMTVELSGEKYITISSIVPLLRGLRFALRSAAPCSHIGQQLQTTCIDLVNRRLGSLETNKMVAKATFLDPRFKKTAFGLDDNANNAQQWVTEELARTLNQNIEPINPQEQSLAVNSPVSSNSGVSLWSFFDDRALQRRHHETPNTTAIVMVRQYIEIPLINRKKDPLEYWKDHAKTFPGLYTLAKKYLSIPATSVPSERLFSKAGYILTERRNRLSSEKLNEIIFLAHNIST